jgi:methylglutaconyl-CoA hydratase
MSYRTLLTRREKGVEHLTLNRPDVRNALNDTMISELGQWAAATRDDAGVRAVVIGGEGSVFSAGADAKWMAKTVGYTRERNIADALALSQAFAAINSLPVPVIGRVQGSAIGGGAGLCAVCDVVVAEEQAVFGFTEVRLGIVPAIISPFVIEKIGRSAARELFLTGARFPAARAREIGLVHGLTPPGQLDPAVEAVVRDVKAGGREAIAAAKALIAEVWSLSPADAQRRTADVIAARRVSAEGQEGLHAFLDKRKPAWCE